MLYNVHERDGKCCNVYDLAVEHAALSHSKPFIINVVISPTSSQICFLEFCTSGRKVKPHLTLLA
jgi:hypothetical protein